MSRRDDARRPLWSFHAHVLDLVDKIRSQTHVAFGFVNARLIAGRFVLCSAEGLHAPHTSQDELQTPIRKLNFFKPGREYLLHTHTRAG